MRRRGRDPPGPRNTRISLTPTVARSRATRPGHSTRFTRTPSHAHGRTYGVDEDTTLAALAGSRPRGRPAAFRHVREQGHLACSLDRDRELTLVPAARSAHPTRPDLPSVGGVPPELIDVLVVDLSYLVLAEEARLPPEHLRLAAARTSWTRSWLAVLPSFRLRCHASNLHPTLREGAGESRDRAESRRKRRASPTRKSRRDDPDAGRERRPDRDMRGDPCDTRRARTPFAVAAGPRG